ncbi:MAG: hypothetical protein MK085_00110 [Phycisphaerales bacterium]|nr:hypothetical protein [Phycisphaerales bacterium]
MPLRVGLSALLLLSLGACAPTPTSGVERMSNAVILGEQAIDDGEIVLGITGPLDIAIDSFGGNIVLEQDPRLDATIVEPVRRANHGHLRRDHAQSTLESMDYRVTLERGDLDREVLRIRSWTDHAEKHFQGIDFRIRTPHLGAVNVRTERGRVWVRDNRGPVDISTTYGDIRVVTTYPMTGPMTMVTKEFPIDYRAGRGSTGIFDCVSKGGEVYQRFNLARVNTTSPLNGPSVFVAEVGGGENPVTLRTTYADIRVAIVEFPTENGTLILDP